jgi:hypothetical protein
VARLLAWQPATTGLDGLRLLVARELTWSWTAPTGFVVTVWAYLALRYRTLLPGDAFLSLFDISFRRSGAIPWILVFGLSNFLGTRNELATSLRHLRALPLSTTRLNTLLIARSMAYWLWMIVLFGVFCFVTIGRFPHVEAPYVILCIGMTALAYSTHSLLRGPLLRLLHIFVLNLVTIELLVPFAILTHPAPLSVALLSMAAAANVWMLHRSSTYRRPERSFMVMRRER